MEMRALNRLRSLPGLAAMLALASCTSLAQDTGGISGRTMRMQWSPDNQFLLFGVETGDCIFNLYLASRKTLTYAKVDDRVIGYWTWAPVGHRFSYASTNYRDPANPRAGVYETVCQVDPKSGRWRVETRSPRPLRESLQWIGNGDQAWIGHGELWDLRSGELKKVLDPEKWGNLSPCPDGSGYLVDQKGDLVWLPASGKEPRILAQRGHWADDWVTNWLYRWSPDSSAWIGGVGSRVDLVEPRTGRVVSFPQDLNGRYFFNRFWWSQDSERILTMSSGCVFTTKQLEDWRSQGPAPLGCIDRRTGEWTALGYLFDPCLAEDAVISEDVEGRGLSVWSADSSRFVIAHRTYREDKGKIIWAHEYTWVQWDGNDFKTLDVPPGYIPVYPVGSNDLDFLPKASWIYAGKLKREK